MFTYTPNFLPNKILMIGAGGTGSRLLPLLAQFLKTVSHFVLNPEITLVDFDEVEQKNLARQNFAPSDVGKPKAQVLAARYSKAYEIPIIPELVRIPNIRTTSKETQAIFNRHKRNALIIMCVDSPQVRRDILEWVSSFADMPYSGVETNDPLLRYRRTVLIIDSGNEEDFGQVVISTYPMLPQYTGSGEARLEAMHKANFKLASIPTTYIPLNAGFFGNMVDETQTAAAKDDKAKAVAAAEPARRSCADLDQTLSINAMMAVTMMGIIQNFYYNKPITFHRVNVSLKAGTQFVPMSAGWWKEMHQHANASRYGSNGAYRDDVTETAIDNAYRSMNELHKATQATELRKKAETDKLVEERILGTVLKQIDTIKKKRPAEPDVVVPEVSPEQQAILDGVREQMRKDREAREAAAKKVLDTEDTPMPNIKRVRKVQSTVEAQAEVEVPTLAAPPAPFFAELQAVIAAPQEDDGDIDFDEEL